MEAKNTVDQVLKEFAKSKCFQKMKRKVKKLFSVRSRLGEDFETFLRKIHMSIFKSPLYKAQEFRKDCEGVIDCLLGQIKFRLLGMGAKGCPVLPQWKYEQTVYEYGEYITEELKNSYCLYSSSSGSGSSENGSEDHDPFSYNPVCYASTVQEKLQINLMREQKARSVCLSERSSAKKIKIPGSKPPSAENPASFVSFHEGDETNSLLGERFGEESEEDSRFQGQESVKKTKIS